MMRNLHVFATASLLATTACAVEVGDADDTVIIDDDGATLDAEHIVIDDSPIALDADVTDGVDDEIGRLGYIPPEPNASEMLINPGFESLLFTYTGWQMRGSTSYVKQLTSAAYNGAYGLRTESTATSTGWVVQCMPAVAGHTYQLTAWTQRIAGEGTGNQMMHLVFHGTMYSPGGIIVPGSTTWNKVSLRRVAPAGTEKACVAVGATSTGAASKRRWDNLSLYRAD
jgi:hypothetical protein